MWFLYLKFFPSFIFGFCFKFHIQLAIAASLVVGVEWSWCLSLLILLMWPRIGILHAQVRSVVSETSLLEWEELYCWLFGHGFTSGRVPYLCNTTLYSCFHCLVPCWFPTSITMSFQVSHQLVLFNLALWLYLVSLCLQFCPFISYPHRSHWHLWNIKFISAFLFETLVINLSCDLSFVVKCW